MERNIKIAISALLVLFIFICVSKLFFNKPKIEAVFPKTIEEIAVPPQDDPYCLTYDCAKL